MSLRRSKSVGVYNVQRCKVFNNVKGLKSNTFSIYCEISPKISNMSMNTHYFLEAVYLKHPLQCGIYLFHDRILPHFALHKLCNAQLATLVSFISAHKVGDLNEKMCKLYMQEPSNFVSFSSCWS